MESWSFGSEGKGVLFTDEMDLPVDAYARSRKSLIGWDLKASADFEAVESMEFMEFGFADTSKRPFYGNTSMGMFGAEFGSDSAKRVVSPMFTSGSYYGEDESGSKHSSSLMESNSQESSLIDLKLGRLGDYSDAQDGKFFKETSVVSSVRPAALTAKRPRTTSSYPHSPCCQVYGCNKDLSSSKDYHKRHKVCEVHSKTPTVIVNGIEQRFCQQCSRFHVLAEFDDGKRSCRKRLAGHNERRRKLNFNTLSGKHHKMLHSYQGTKFLGTSMPKKLPFVIPNMFQGDFIYPEIYEKANQCLLVKSEEKPICIPQSAIAITNGQLRPKSFLHVHGSGKQVVPGTFPSATGSLNAPNAASTVKESFGVSLSGGALSLLSAQSQDLSSHATDIQMTRPLINQADRAHNSFEKSGGFNSFEKASGFYSSGMNSMEILQAGTLGVFSDAYPANYEVRADGYFQDSDLLSARYCLSPEHGSTVDLLQLSTHLQRVERQKNSAQVKQEHEDLSYFLTA